MSHTNSTTNYNLPQFVGTDKPTWLNDVNGAMSAIDTQMKANADSATSASTSATTANNAIGTLSNLNTTTKTDLVSAVNEVNTNLGTVSGVASGASSNATQALTKATALETAFNFTQFRQYVNGDLSGSGITNAGVDGLACACNADGSVGKIYGSIWLDCNSSSGLTVRFPSPLRPSSKININGVCYATRQSGGTYSTIMADTTFSIDTDGTVEFSKGGGWYNQNAHFAFSACVLFLKDFGDTPIPE